MTKSTKIHTKEDSYELAKIKEVYESKLKVLENQISLLKSELTIKEAFNEFLRSEIQGFVDRDKEAMSRENEIAS